MEITVREQIRKPHMEVFGVLCRPEQFLSRWARGVVEVTEVSNSSVQANRKFKIGGRDLGRKVYWVYDQTDFEAGVMIGGKASGGPVAFSETFRLEVVAPGITEIIHTQTIRPHGLFQLASPLVEMVWPRLMHSNLKQLKRLLEGNKLRTALVSPN